MTQPRLADKNTIIPIVYHNSKEDLINASLEYLKKKRKKVNVRMRFVFWRTR